MKYWILFPHEQAFYLGMGRELYEQEKGYRSFCRKAERKLSLPLHRSLFYQEMPYPEHLCERQAAVMVVSLANFQLFRETYPEAGTLLLSGQGMGLLTALVAAEALSLEAAVGRLRGKALSSRQIQAPKLPVYSLSRGAITEKDQILEAVETALREKEPWVLPEEYPALDIGPGRVCFDALQQNLISRLDEPGDPQFIWAGFHSRRLWNRDYCAKRILGVVAATPNENDACDGKRLDAQEKELRDLLQPLFAQSPQSVSQEAFDRCVEIMRESFKEKKTPAEEIAQRFRLLEQETLIPFPAKE